MKCDPSQENQNKLAQVIEKIAEKGMLFSENAPPPENC
jgi:hypothetical protein